MTHNKEHLNYITATTRKLALKTIAKYNLPSCVDVDDLAQEGAIRALTSNVDYNDPYWRTYLYTLIRYGIIDSLRRGKRNASRGKFFVIPLTDLGYDCDNIGHVRPKGDFVESKEDAVSLTLDVNDALRSLDDRSRGCVKMWIDGEYMHDIADSYGVTESRVSQIIRAACQEALKVRLRDYVC